MRFVRCFSLAVMMLLALLVVQVYAVEVNIAIDGDFADWADIPVAIEDPDDIAEDNGDLKEIRVFSTETTLYVLMTVYGDAAPPPPDAQRYYYHVLIDADTNLDTGFSNAIYEGNETGVKNPIGADFYIQVGRKNGADDGIEVYFLGDGDGVVIGQDFEWKSAGDSLELAVPFEMFNAEQLIGQALTTGHAIRVASFQEGSANGWEVDWTEPAEHLIGVPLAVEPAGKLPLFWAQIK